MQERMLVSMSEKMTVLGPSLLLWQECKDNQHSPSIAPFMLSFSIKKKLYFSDNQFSRYHRGPGF